ncbi:uncharacterized protein FTOL_07825 [Fusarium torulosum]|uniref:Azaphilone pigments biosynthesis cluster protein L N-terminal domain-containing protein n=1 Tax=Fusarium torulosum TaxID=33205 RepID=A0AAE8SJD3_9HYPO|nr:uncharacterized protein FTOL_07825 [Fusarium torulosum]
MDPLSIIASIAGIATAGVQLSKTLFHLTRTYRNAPREIQSMAIEMSGLTVTLEHLRDILTTGHAYTKPLFFEGVRNVIKNIQSTQQEIQNLAKKVDDQPIFARFKWYKSTRLLSDIDKHKVTLTLQITILSAAVLVKSTNGSLSGNEKSDNRFKIQAESLIQAGQASLQADKTSRPIPDPPQERAPSPPVRTTKRLPSPVRQSEIHVRTEDLYSQSSTTRHTLNVPEEGGDESYSVVARTSKAPEGPSRDAHADIKDDKSETNSEWEDDGEDEDLKRGRGTGFDPLSGRIAQFGRDFHLRGDAATFLYKLVYLDEVTAYTPTAYDEGSGQETEEDAYADSSDDSRPLRVRSRIPSRHVNPERQEPGRVVNQLLLAWTSLSETEIEKGSSDSQPNARENSARQAYVVSEAEDEDEDDNERVQTSLPRPGSPNASEHGKHNIPEYNSRGRRILRPSQFNKNSRNEAYRRSYLGEAESEQSPYIKYSQPWAYAQAENAHEPTAWSQPYSYPPGLVPPPPTAFTYPPPPEAQAPVQSTEPEPKPHVVILPYADPANSETGPTTPKLDIAPCLSMSIVRQNEIPMWNCDKFTSQHGIPGKAIMGALAGDKNLRAMELAHTLVKGQNLELVYIRGNDLGETWFINERPVFLQFLHCGYLPQFYPAKEDDDKAMQQEYVAIGEEWASSEALNLLGLSVKSRKEGRVFLDPSTNWSMIDELAITTLQLRCMRQRRVYLPTFYNSIATFRQKHREVAPPLCISIPEMEILPSTKPESQSITGDDKKEVDVLSFLVTEEPPKAQEEGINRTRNNTQSSNIQPQISITPPPTPKEVQTAEFDTSEVTSNVSSRSRFSKFVKRYKAGRKQDRLPLALPSYGSKTSGGHAAYVESEDEDKRPLTPTDSGVGSSIA